MREYLVRAHLEFIWDMEQESDKGELTRPSRLPRDLGPFRLDESPNVRLYLADLGWVDYGLVQHLSPDRRYPVSLLYIESTVSVPDNGNARSRADEVLEPLECLLRLFQPGGVSVRRHSNYMPRLVGQDLKETIFFPGVPVKPETATLYERPPYPLDDDVVDRFIAFFDGYWLALQGNTPPYLTTGMMRFNSSYERRDLADRLVDLVVALEAMFGDGESGSIAYKVAARCAAWLHPPGKARLAAFRLVKKLYGGRNKVVHGEKQERITVEQVDKLEAVVRMSLVKFLDHLVSVGNVPHGNDFEDMIMTGKM